MEEKNSMSMTSMLLMAIVAVVVLGAVFYMVRNGMEKKEDGVMVGGALMTPDKNIVENAMNADNVTTVVAAVSAADLADDLQSDGPFTVFAPTNAAFDKLPAGTLDTLLLPENKMTLSSILTYHVVSGKYSAKDLMGMSELTTLNGQKLMISSKDGKVMIKDAMGNTATVETADVISLNGITHVIDSVLMPEEGVMVGGALMTPNLDIVENALNASNVTTVVTAVKAAGLVETLQGVGPFTVFAPNNDAFAKLPAGTVDTLLMPENKAQLTGILTYHIVSGKYKISDLKDGQILTTVNGQTLTVKKNGTTIMINGATISPTERDVISSNGVTHVIDTVLMPK